MEQFYNKHYIRIDANNQIIKGFSDTFETAEPTDICINQEGGRHFELLGQINPSLIDMNGCHLYKYVDGAVSETTSEERVAELEAIQLPIVKEQKIAETKNKLKDYLANNPFTWTDGNQYSVTEEKQNLLSNAIAVYQLKLSAGDTTAKLTWNSVGKTCTEWTIGNLTALAIAISSYVYPLVSHQQTLEVSIRNCKTLSELDKVVISYATAN